MDINKYLHNLPPEVLLNGEFCVTQLNDKKPYDPFKKTVIGSKDPFYSIEELLNLGIEKYDTIGIKVQGDISSIDIDHCVSGDIITDEALDIIHNIRSYTEVSPSGTGIRILFTASNPFNREKYKIKNSLNGVEYYDGQDQLTKGGRMVRLSGDRIFTEYNFSEVDTTDILDRYMMKDHRDTLYKMVEGDINENKCYFIGEYLKKDYSIYNIYYRHMAILSESEWDLLLLNHISFYTDNLNEIRYIFENTTYFKNKDQRHLNKWKRVSYSGNLLKALRPSLGNTTVLNYIKLFDTYEPQEIQVVDPNLLAYLAIQIGFTKPSYLSKLNLNPIVSKNEQDIVNHLIILANNRKHLLNYIKSLLKE